MSGFDIGRRHVGDGAPCFIIGEVGLAHDGSLAMAHSFVDAIADAGADAVKFQCHRGQAEQEWRVAPPKWFDRTRDEYWRRTDFTTQGWWSLVEHARERNVEFLCSPFSLEAVQMLTTMVPAWKVPSGEVRPSSLIAALSESGKPAIVSTGMATDDEVIWATGFYPVALLQCTSEYPTRPERVGLSYMMALRERHSCPVGLSDHSGSIYPSIAAVALGASIVEVHVILSEYQWGFDTSSSVTVDEFAEMVDGIRIVEEALKPVDKDVMAKELEPMRRVFMGANA